MRETRVYTRFFSSSALFRRGHDAAAVDASDVSYSTSTAAVTDAVAARYTKPVYLSPEPSRLTLFLVSFTSFSYIKPYYSVLKQIKSDYIQSEYNQWASEPIIHASVRQETIKMLHSLVT